MIKKKEFPTYWECEYCGHYNESKKRVCVKCKTSKKIWQMTNKTKKKYY